jgi:hypothetical protein
MGAANHNRRERDGAGGATVTVGRQRTVLKLTCSPQNEFGFLADFRPVLLPNFLIYFHD